MAPAVAQGAAGQGKAPYWEARWEVTLINAKKRRARGACSSLLGHPFVDGETVKMVARY